MADSCVDKTALNPASDPNPVRRAIRSPLAVFLFLAVAALSLAGDLLSKQWVFDSFLSQPELSKELAQLQPSSSVPTKKLMRDVAPRLQRQIFPGVKFTLSTNPGIVFGNNLLPRWLVNVVTVATILLIFVFFATSSARAWAMHLATAFILAGAIGNLYDRLFAVVALPVAGIEPIRNEVRDFIDCSGLYYPYVFNVADVLLVLGVGIILVSWFFTKKTGGGSKPVQAD